VLAGRILLIRPSVTFFLTEGESRDEEATQSIRRENFGIIWFANNPLGRHSNAAQPVLMTSLAKNG
jgi:hypothetical protein